ncbi:MAG: ABC transporter permease [Bacteroidetes bacterium]|nr:ABC transporter permease [Bacteroidota bacterium]
MSKRKIYSFINISGLAIGIAACLVIWKYVEFELSYDKFHTHADNIYRATFTEYGKNWKEDWSAEFGYGLGPALINEIPEIKNFVRIHPMYGDAALISLENQHAAQGNFLEKNIYFVDSTFLSVFTYDVVKGDASNGLARPSSAVITETIANRYFGNADPIGKTLHVRTKDWVNGDFTVTAVIQNVPRNSHLQFDILLSMHDLLQIGYYREAGSDWTANNFITYVEMSKNTDAKSLDAKTKRFMDKHVGTEPLGVKLSYQPLREINYSPDLDNTNGHLSTLYFFILISIFILFIAWINYVNLSTARATERAKEVGVKKAIGVLKSQLVTQFMLESLLINFVSIVLAVGLAIVLLPVLNNIIANEILFDFSSPLLWAILLGLFAIGSLISGIYPAMVLSSFKTTDAFKGNPGKVGRGLGLRKTLVVFQFTASLLLIAGTFIIYRQMDFMVKHDKGLNMNQMLIVTGPQYIEGETGHQRILSFKNELLKLSSVGNVTSSGAIPGGGYSFTTGMEIAGKGPKNSFRESIHVVWVDTDFIKTYGLQIASGSAWDSNRASAMESVFINEAALNRLGFGTAEQALHEKIIIGGEARFSIQGVLRNFHWNSLKSEYVPMLFRPQEANYKLFSIQLHSNIHESVEQVQRIYKGYFPGNPFEYYFLDDFFNSQYKDEEQFERIFSMFSILAIVIACLGLWGLASFTTAQRLKEISIRKVLGATVTNIIYLLSGQFVRLLLISSIIALPILLYAGNTWIDHFAFRIDITADLFIIPLMVLVVIALGTVSIQILRGAHTNPAKVLRSE